MADRNIELAHHFADIEQQRESATFGMWVFLVTEAMLFGGLFTAYSVYRARFPYSFAEGSNHLDVVLGTLNTAILIGSSLAMAMAHHSAETCRRKPMMMYLGLTIVLGSVFLGIKFYEYYHKFHEHLVPGMNFHVEGPYPGHQELFFSFYFAMTGLHATHMILGIGFMLALIVMTPYSKFSTVAPPVEVAGLYWHFVDIVWIFLFPLLYLIGRT